MSSVPAEDERHESDRDDEAIARQVRDIAGVGRRLEELQRASEEAGLALEEQLRAAVRQHLEQAANRVQGVGAELHRDLAPVLDRAADLVVKSVKLDIDAKRGRVELSTQRPELRGPLHELLFDALDAMVADASLRAELRGALDQAVKSLHGERLEMDPAVLASLQQIALGLQQTKKALRETRRP